MKQEEFLRDFSSFYFTMRLKAFTQVLLSLSSFSFTDTPDTHRKNREEKFGEIHKKNTHSGATDGKLFISRGDFSGISKCDST
jgi:hypothetical protein